MKDTRGIKICVTRTDAIGDMVLSTPIFQILKRNYPTSRLYVYCRKYCADIIKSNPNVDEIIIEEHQSLLTESKRLRSYNFDLYISLYEHPYYMWLGFFAKIKTRVGFANSPFSWMGYTKSCRFPWKDPFNHQVDCHLELLKLLEINSFSNDDKTPRIYSDSKHRLNNRVTVALDGRPFNRVWDKSEIASIVRQLIQKGYQVDLVGDEQSRHIGSYISNEVISDDLVDLTGTLSLLETINRIDESTFYVGHDTGLMHIAAALGVKVVVYFITKHQCPGRFYPRGVDFQLIKPWGQCPYICNADKCKHSDCLSSIEAKDVLLAFDRIVRKDASTDIQASVLSVLKIGSESMDKQTDVHFVHVSAINFHNFIKVIKLIISDNIWVIHASTPSILNKILLYVTRKVVSMYPFLIVNNLSFSKDEYVDYIRLALRSK